uniref:Uncharacterized protein n=1 Tax=Podoviridae sp. ctiJY10 TaxID=2826572 RepID=A0A8S5N417_9CAUD|nr:MAG TPA: hypothetical protein [Podoviridae sp. ctiJY10]
MERKLVDTDPTWRRWLLVIQKPDLSDVMKRLSE